LRGALVYLAVNPEVSVYSYPGGKRAGTLDGISNPVALCSDTSGNVWVIDFDSRNRSTLLKYAHGGSEPIASLHLNGRGDACSVDPSTGNLAVGTLSSRIAVWTNGQGSPAMYSTHAFFHAVRTVAYDGNGNLYMRSFNRGEPAAWLPKGAPAAIEFHITKLGSYAWDGRYLVIGPANSYAGPLTRYKLHGGSGKVVGNVSVDDCAADYEPSFSIVDSDLVVSCGLDETNSLNYYRYPKGGKPITHFNAGASGSVAISVAPSEK
jgi:WD40 repeat protein